MSIYTGTQAMPSSDFRQGIGALKVAQFVRLQKKLLSLKYQHDLRQVEGLQS